MQAALWVSSSDAGDVADSMMVDEVQRNLDKDPVAGEESRKSLYCCRDG
jgi:hypothetical protein